MCLPCKLEMRVKFSLLRTPNFSPIHHFKIDRLLRGYWDEQQLDHEPMHFNDWLIHIFYKMLLFL